MNRSFTPAPYRVLGPVFATVRAFDALGFNADLTQAEIGEAYLGPGEVRRRERGSREAEDASQRAAAAARVIAIRPLYRRSDKPKDRGKRFGLWAEVKRLLLFLLMSNLG